MHVFPTSARLPAVAVLAAATALAALPPAPAHAKGADGTWRCIANGNIPIGVVTILGGAYDFVTTNVSWEPVDNADNGSGTLAYEGDNLIPQDGPLATSFEVTGSWNADGEISWNNNFGALMVCHEAG